MRLYGGSLLLRQREGPWRIPITTTKVSAVPYASPESLVVHPRPTAEAIFVMRSRVTALAAGQPLRRAVVALYVATSVAVVLQRGIVGPQHNVFRIFRQSFWHLVCRLLLEKKKTTS